MEHNNLLGVANTSGNDPEQPAEVGFKDNDYRIRT